MRFEPILDRLRRTRRRRDKTRSSLHRQLLQWQLVPLVMLVVYNSWESYSDARLVAGIVTDRMLVGSAQTIGEQIKLHDGVAEATIPPAALEMFDSGDHDRVIYRVTDWDGTLLAGYSDVPGPPAATEAFEPSYIDAVFRGQPVRAVTFSQPLVGTPQHFALVVVGETLRRQNRMITALWLHDAERQAVLVLIALALAWFGLNRGLAPLVRISDEIAQRAPDTLDPIATERVQKELEPLVAALNHSVERVRSQILAQRRFIADAAHQLRTPLTILKTQISVGLDAEGGAEKDVVLTAALDSAEQMVRLTNQLLTLARIEPGVQPLPRDPVDLAVVTCRVLEECADRAAAKRIALSFDEAAPGAVVLASRQMLHELAMNIVDNALRYVPAGGAIAVTVGRVGEQAILRVEDNGPGIPAAERERVFDRFYRILGTDVDGVGLGLAIVREIAKGYDGTVTLSDPPGGSGLCVEVVLPACAPIGGGVAGVQTQ
jgi:two-component system sensor histidine kinase TctE